jgi:hypothetical protein
MLTIGLKATVSFFVKPRNYKVKDGFAKSILSSAEWMSKLSCLILFRIVAVVVSFPLSLEGEKLLQTSSRVAE